MSAMMWFMPTRTSEWTAFDYAVTACISEMVSENHLSYRDVSRLTRGQIRVSRVRCLLTARKAPARVSEFAYICKITGNSPVEQFAKACQLSLNLGEGTHDFTFIGRNGEVRVPTIEELARQPIVADRLIRDFTVVRENPELEMRASAI